ncbi:hypothetical protein CLF_101607 [Clonorchis sinensis]|uniref:Reverse transcriptase domain-containing protein n=1 Tax=Clonorchis sinensis TaxID=79923 RepID=G7Y649_CLOSI|nr:hypothetical protein CLF_101607 [Clonorchis sinensis]
MVASTVCNCEFLASTDGSGMDCVPVTQDATEHSECVRSLTEFMVGRKRTSTILNNSPVVTVNRAFGLRNSGYQIACDGNLIHLEYVDDIVLVFEEKAHVFLNELTKVITSFECLTRRLFMTEFRYSYNHSYHTLSSTVLATKADKGQKGVVSP